LAQASTFAVVETPESPVLQRLWYDWVVPDDPNPNVYLPGSQFLHFLPGMMNRFGSDSSLHAALWALAYANFAQRCNAPECMPLAIANCTSAINSIRLAMNDPNKASNDDVLVSIQLLSFYEVSISGTETYQHV
jgi:hypothetical protein